MIKLLLYIGGSIYLIWSACDHLFNRDKIWQKRLKDGQAAGINPEMLERTPERDRQMIIQGWFSFGAGILGLLLALNKLRLELKWQQLLQDIAPSETPTKTTIVSPVSPKAMSTAILTEPRQPASQLVVRTGPNPGQVFDLPAKPIITIGRDRPNEIMINDPEMSRYHMRIIQVGGEGTEKKYYIEDLGSANGTFLNGVRLTKAEAVYAGDRIGFGETVVIQVL